MIVFSSAPKLTLIQNHDGHLRTEFAMRTKEPCQGQTTAEKFFFFPHCLFLDQWRTAEDSKESRYPN